jgi:argininosuccinate lyase
MKKLWVGRFRKPTAPELESLSRSIDFDRRLWLEDVLVNRAYARELREVGVLSAAELEQVLKALDSVEVKLRENPPLADEDIHTAVERVLAEVIEDPEVASKLPTGRSRNDLAATGFRMHLAVAIVAALEYVRRIQTVLVEKAKASTKVLLPGYTHMRRGQPVVFAQYLLAWFWALERDRRGRAAGNGAGSRSAPAPWREILRGRSRPLARELGFPHLSQQHRRPRGTSRSSFPPPRLGVNLAHGRRLDPFVGRRVLVRLFDESYATGSSLMPQKQNRTASSSFEEKDGPPPGRFRLASPP